MLKYQPSLLAASALYLARKVCLGDRVEWTQTLQETTLHSVDSMRSCAKDMLIMLKGIQNCTLQAVRKKFMFPKFDNVANLKIDFVPLAQKQPR